MCTSSRHQYRVRLARPYGSKEPFRPEVFPLVGGGLLMGWGHLSTGSHDNVAVWVTRQGHSHLLAKKENGQVTIFEGPLKGMIRLSEYGNIMVDHKSVGLEDHDSLDILPIGEKPFCAP